MIRFEHIEYLLLLLLLPVMATLFYWVLRWKKMTIKKIGDEALVRQLVLNFSDRQFLFKFCLVGVAFLTMALAASNLQSASQVENTRRRGVDVMIALDVSRSMEAQDIRPNRLERAKQMISRLMDKLENDRIGFVVFAGRAYLQMPLTSDHAAARLYINSASPEAIPVQGTVISEALRTSNIAFDKNDKKYKTIVLITDGEDHDDGASDVAEQLVAAGVVINTVGVGSTQGSSIRNPLTGESKRDAEGTVVISKLNEQELIDLASKGNGVYQQLNDTETVTNKLVQQIESMEQKTINDVSQLNFRSFFQWFLALALILLIADLFIPERKFRTR